jgi:hypothetical protein
MFLFTAAHTLARSFSFALLGVVSMRWLAFYVIGDFLLYCLYKLARGDLWYGSDLGDGALGYLGTFVMRVGDKVLTDSTAFMQMRHPGQAGGLFFSLTLAMAQISCYACGWIYLKFFEEVKADEEEGTVGVTKLSEKVVWGAIGSLNAAFVFGWIAFLLVMEREFIITFFSTDTYSTFLKKWFAGISDGDDEQKSGIFDSQRSHRRKMERDIRAWTLANWERWEREKPQWFTDRWIDSVPNDCIPYEFCVKYKKTKGRQEKRRASVSVREMLGGEAEAR